jgi:hypothetical protein
MLNVAPNIVIGVLRCRDTVTITCRVFTYCDLLLVGQSEGEQGAQHRPRDCPSHQQRGGRRLRHRFRNPQVSDSVPDFGTKRYQTPFQISEPTGIYQTPFQISEPTVIRLPSRFRNSQVSDSVPDFGPTGIRLRSRFRNPQVSDSVPDFGTLQVSTPFQISEPYRYQTPFQISELTGTYQTPLQIPKHVVPN